jgi:hypothetical protein
MRANQWPTSLVFVIQQYVALCHAHVDRFKGHCVGLEEISCHLSVVVANTHGSDRRVLNSFQIYARIRKGLIAFDDHSFQTHLRQSCLLEQHWKPTNTTCARSLCSVPQRLLRFTGPYSVVNSRRMQTAWHDLVVQPPSQDTLPTHLNEVANTPPNSLRSSCFVLWEAN